MPIYALDALIPELPAADRFWIAPDAHVMGHVRLAEDVGIWFCAVLRGDNDLISIGARSNVQDGAMIHTDRGQPVLVGEDVTIGHHAILHGCTIGDGSLIGMGATILNGAKIGRGCLVGANALVTEGKEFPDFSMIMGAPAKVTRPLDEAAVARLRAGPAGYVRNWQRFKAGLRRLD